MSEENEFDDFHCSWIFARDADDARDYLAGFGFECQMFHRLKREEKTFHAEYPEDHRTVHLVTKGRPRVVAEILYRTKDGQCHRYSRYKPGT